MVFVEKNYKSDSLENIIDLVVAECMAAGYNHYVAIFGKKNCLSPYINMRAYWGNSPEEFEEFINIYPEYRDMYNSSAIFKDNIMLDESNGCRLFKYPCRGCKHKVEDKEVPDKYICDCMNQEIGYITYICFEHEKKTI